MTVETHMQSMNSRIPTESLTTLAKLTLLLTLLTQPVTDSGSARIAMDQQTSPHAMLAHLSMCLQRHKEMSAELRT